MKICSFYDGNNSGKRDWSERKIDIITKNNEKMNKITMLGTGNATVSQIYNTCFVLQTPSTLMLVDAGGGNGILSQLKKVNVQISDIH